MNRNSRADVRRSRDLWARRARQARILLNTASGRVRLRDRQLSKLQTGPAKAIKFLRDRLGWHENGTTNRAPWLDAWEAEIAGIQGQPWCVIAVMEAYKAATATVLHFAACDQIVAAARKNQNGLTLVPVSQERAGDWRIYNFRGGQTGEHIGLVTSTDGSTIEANTSNGNPADGGSIEIKHRPASQVIHVVRPTYR